LANLPLKFVHRYRDRHGRFRHYFRRTGFKSIRLPGLPGSPEFMAAYQTALAGATAPRIEIGVGRTKPGSVAAAVAAYLGSIDFRGLAYATQRDRRRILERFRDDFGSNSFATLTRNIVERMLATKAATPHAAKSFLKTLRGMVAVALRVGLCESDPTVGIRVKVRATTQGFRSWTEDEIARFEAAHPIGTRARLAFALLLYTGQRRGEVITMGRQHVKGGILTVRQGKTGAVVFLPILPELQAILAASEAGQMTFLTTATGKPFTGGSFTNWFGAACRAAGLPLGLSAHGLRKAMCRRLAEAGCSANQIAAISGHATLREVGRYTKAADQRRMAVAAMETIQRTPGGEPSLSRLANPPQVIEKKG
jgi:integrase